MIVPVVLSGGAGTRLWPASRRLRPKQLLPLVNETSMIHDTLERLDGLDNVAEPIVVTAATLELPVRRALADAGLVDATIMLEPVGRNTAPAVAVAAHEILRTHGDALMLVLPADHVITDDVEFRRAVATAATAAERGLIVTFGITPTSPETGYGYIRAGGDIDTGIVAIDEFKEKPDLATAQRYLSDGGYAWNSGMFVFGAQRFLDELAQHRQDIAEGAAAAFAQADRTRATVDLPEAAFGACPSESIDFAVMEHTSHGAMVPTDPGWSDVGSWSSLWELGSKDEHGNVLRGDIIAEDTSGSYVRGSDRVIGVVGLDDVVVVDTSDALLVAARDGVQDVKEIVDVLHQRHDPTTERDQVDEHSWGRLTHISDGPGHRLAIVAIDPGASCPLGDATHHVQLVNGAGSVDTASGHRDIQEATTVTVTGPATIEASNDMTLRILLLSVDTVFGSNDMQAFVERSEP